MFRTVLRTPEVIKQAYLQAERGHVSTDLLDASIGQSWLRCLESGLRVGSQPELPQMAGGELKHEMGRNERFLRLSSPLAERLSNNLNDCQVILASPDATILKQLGRHQDFMDDVVMDPGVRMPESLAGTNGPGLCLIERKPVLVNSCEHLLYPDVTVSCVAAPLFDLHGDVLGLIDFTFAANHPRPDQFLDHANWFSAAFEHQLFLDSYRDNWILQVQALSTWSQQEPSGLLAFNDDGSLVAASSHALKAFVTTETGLVGCPVESIFGVSWGAMVDHCRKYPGVLSLERTGRQMIGRLSPPSNWRSVTPLPLRKPVKLSAMEALIRTWPDELAAEARRGVRALEAGMPVLLQGDTGTGKEQFARALHTDSGATGPFVAINCAALPEGMIEGELFGYRDGAFTGARKGGYNGRFLQAQGGTLLLDEIGDMPLELQARLLRVIQERTVTPLGGHEELPIDCRIVAASLHDLEELVDQGRFREDLYFRLAAVVVELLALHQQTDLADAVDRLWQEVCGRHGRFVDLDAELRKQLAGYHWPGNWRELENCLEALLVGAQPNSYYLTSADLPIRWRRKFQQHDLVPPPTVASLADREPQTQNLKDMEWEHMQRTLQACNGNYSAAAKTLGISRSTLYRRLNKEAADSPGRVRIPC
ncbi:sigma 54-interacting transcriptional regulator [Marinobacter bryozoorum]|uniref:sigma-54-dependent Fis family transcriptional regulator n=1 Tax=Marinobacter bryozoorum TaxID=256324 RepID=UPI0020060038|nr:sigma 54-interacting transcriptional regulator [Marinobacter bryozoorum]MCK7543516.1 sigma 54-interacting transcriptional regulator [Marinobacter bryozoorum]